MGAAWLFFYFSFGDDSVVGGNGEVVCIREKICV